jgi:hypothetical protein
LELSASGLDFAQSFNDHWIMVTPLAKQQGHTRWKNSPYSQEIKELFLSGFFDSIILSLDLNLAMSYKMEY